MDTRLVRSAGIALIAALAVGLSGCLDATSGAGGSGINANRAACANGTLLIPATCTVNDATNRLGNLLGGSTIPGAGALVNCLGPTVSGVLNGANPLVAQLLTALGASAGTPNIADVQNAAEALASGLASAGKNIPLAVSALAGNQQATQQCVSESTAG